MLSYRMIPGKKHYFLVMVLIVPQMLIALQPTSKESEMAAREFFKPELFVSSSTLSLAEIRPRLINPEAADKFRETYGNDFHFFYDPRSGTPVNVIGAIPLLPGDGVGNRVTLADLGQSLGRPVGAVDGAVVAGVMRRFFLAHQELLAIDAAQLGEIRAELINEQLWQVNAPQTVRGVPVRHGRLLATISHGNLILFGAERWGNVILDLSPVVTPELALQTGFSHIGGMRAGDKLWRSPELEIVPFAPPEYQRGEAFSGPVGRGYGHRLVWQFGMSRPGEVGHWEFRVDAHSGELLSFEDGNQYLTKQIKGGIYPITSTGICPAPDICGVMQADYPMPFANTGLAAPNNFTNSAGNFDWTTGVVTTTLSGRYVRVVDSCGAISESTASPDLNLGGANNQHDCTSGGASAGNTPASRTAFYEVNKLAELARGWLPGNSWLNAQLTSNMNLNQTCNAYWSGGTINFFRSGGGCRNTGEIAAVFDHEWGHGMDDNDANPVISNPGEAYADIVGILKLQSSCVGYGFFETQDFNCGRTPDNTGPNYNERQTAGASHCDTMCSGVRDADWRRHADNLPDTPLGFVCTHCNSSSAVCGRQVHCAAAPVRQAAWDFAKFDLQAAPFSYDQNRAFIVANKAFYQGSGNIGDWYSCTCGSASAGCAAANGYMQWLAADDDDGNINNGTPHMTALYAAYNRHAIACATPAPTNSGCTGAPASAPALTAMPGNNASVLSWTAVTGATQYWVFRGEGNGACDSGKARIATVAAPTLTYTDSAIANGRAYYYSVVPATANSACFGPSSACVAVTPQPCLFPGAPTIGAATVPGGNQINVSWSQGAPASSLFNIYRGIGTCAAATLTLSTAGRPASPANYTDATVSGGTTYAYRVTGTDATGTCESGQTVCVEATATGTCTLAPNFAGAAAASNNATASCGINVSWAAGASNCGGGITYSIHRSTTPGFIPSAANRIAAGLTGSSFVDSGTIASGTTYYYILRATDSLGNADANTVERSATPTGPFTSGTWSDNAGDTGTAKLTLASPWSVALTGGSTGSPRVYLTGTYTDNLCAAIVTPPLDLGTGSSLTFQSHYATETGWDKGLVQVSTDGGTSWSTIPVNYPTTATQTGDACGFGAVASFTGTNAAYAAYTASLATWNGQTVLLRWALSTDSSVTGAGWWVDDISITNVNVPSTCISCTTASAMSPMTDAKSGANLVMNWPEVAGAISYRVYRENNARVALWTAPPVAAGLTGLSWTDINQLSNAQTRFYSITNVNACGAESPK